MARPKRSGDDKAKVPASIAPQPAPAPLPQPASPGMSMMMAAPPGLPPMAPPPPPAMVFQQQLPLQPVGPPMLPPLQHSLHQSQHPQHSQQHSQQGGLLVQAPTQSPSSRNITIDHDSFIRVQNSNLAQIQLIINLMESARNCIKRTGTLLLGEASPDGPGNLDPMIPLNAAAASLSSLQNPEIVAPADDSKKERKKRSHDPNAPKRPLTPYFLYMQHARGIIASDLGPEFPKGAVQEEGQRRWGAMPAEEKKGWNEAYKFNLKLYNARVHSYKAGNIQAKDMMDEDARMYADEHGIDIDRSRNSVSVATPEPPGPDNMAMPTHLDHHAMYHHHQAEPILEGPQVTDVMQQQPPQPQHHNQLPQMQHQNQNQNMQLQHHQNLQQQNLQQQQQLQLQNHQQPQQPDVVPAEEEPHEEELEEEEEEEEDKVPPAPTPKKTSTRKRKTPASLAESEPAKTTPVKKPRRTSARALEEAPEPKKSGRKKPTKG